MRRSERRAGRAPVAMELAIEREAGDGEKEGAGNVPVAGVSSDGRKDRDVEKAGVSCDGRDARRKGGAGNT